MRRIFLFCFFIIIFPSLCFADLNALKEWSYQETLSSSDLNNEFSNLYNNKDTYCEGISINAATIGLTTGDLDGNIVDSSENILLQTGDTFLRAALKGYSARDAGFISYNNSTAITISGNVIESDNKLCWWDADLTFDLGSNGDNSSSSDLGNNEIHVICIDTSSVTSGTELTASNFINTTTDPSSFSTSKYGLYVSSDRVIGVILTDGSGDILKFYWNNDSYYSYDAIISEETDVGGTSFTASDLSSSIPNIGKVNVKLNIVSNGDGATTNLLYYLRSGESSSASPITLGESSGLPNYDMWDMVNLSTNSTQNIEYKTDNANLLLDIYVVGFWFKI